MRLFQSEEGRNFIMYPAPIWPSRKRFLAAKILTEGAIRVQKLMRCSYFMALYTEILNVFSKKEDSFSIRIYQKIIDLGITHQYTAKRFIKRV